MLPIYAHTLELLKDSFPELTVAIHVAPNKHVEEYISDTVHEWPVPVVLISGGSPCMKYNAFSVSLQSSLHTIDNERTLISSPRFLID